MMRKSAGSGAGRPQRPARVLYSLLIPLLALLAPPTVAQYDRYNWAEPANSWYAYHSAAPDRAGMKYQAMVLSSKGDAVYVLTTSGAAPPGMQSGAWPTNGLQHAVVMVHDAATGAVLRSAAVARSAAVGRDYGWALTLAPAAQGQAADTDVLYVGGVASASIGTLEASHYGGTDVFVAKLTVNTADYSQALQLSWVAQHGSAADEVVFSLAVSQDGAAVYAAGFTQVRRGGGACKDRALRMHVIVFAACASIRCSAHRNWYPLVSHCALDGFRAQCKASLT